MGYRRQEYFGSGRRLYGPRSLRGMVHTYDVRNFGFSVAAALLTAVLSGCAISAPKACPAIGWSNQLPVEVAGNTARIRALQLCFDGNCRMVKTRLDSVSTDPFETLPPNDVGAAPWQGADTAEPTPQDSDTTDSLPLFATHTEENRWEIHLMMRSPQNITIRALAPNQEILAEQDYELEWVRVGGSEECGGPAEAESVTLHL